MAPTTLQIRRPVSKNLFSYIILVRLSLTVTAQVLVLWTQWRFHPLIQKLVN